MLQRPWAPLQADDAGRVTQLLSQHCDLLWGGSGLRLTLVRSLLGVRQLLGPPNRDLHSIAMPSGGQPAAATIICWLASECLLRKQVGVTRTAEVH